VFSFSHFERTCSFPYSSSRSVCFLFAEASVALESYAAFRWYTMSSSGLSVTPLDFLGHLKQK